MSKDAEAARWKELAVEALAAAAEMTSPEARAIMLDIAERYARLAQYAEERSKRKKSE